MGKNKNKGQKVAEDFARYFGENKLENWQRLCRDIGINKELPSITRCREVCFVFYLFYLYPQSVSASGSNTLSYCLTPRGEDAG